MSQTQHLYNVVELYDSPNMPPTPIKPQKELNDFFDNVNTPIKKNLKVEFDKVCNELRCLEKCKFTSLIPRISFENNYPLF
jgi:hypothetical protein